METYRIPNAIILVSGAASILSGIDDSGLLLASRWWCEPDNRSRATSERAAAGWARIIMTAVGLFDMALSTDWLSDPTGQ